jgi:Domain of unknown function (DUF3850)
MTHIEKIVTIQEFENIQSEDQTFLILKNDKPFRIDDTLIFQREGEESELTAKITHIKNGDTQGLKANYCAVGFKIESPKE